MTMPTISAIVRVYNGEDHVADTVTSILGQTRPADEILVVDDGSTDATPRVLAAFGDRIRVVRQPNGGLASAFNRAFAEARGDYVAICDADDLWVRVKLERQVMALTAHPEVDLAFGAAWIFGTADGPWGYFRIAEPMVVEPDRFVRDLFRDNVITTSSVIIRRRLFERVGPFEEHNGAEDYDYWLRTLRAGATVYYDPSVLVRYRRHEGQITESSLRMWESGLEVRQLHVDLVGDRRFTDTVLADNRFRIGRMLVDAGRSRPARGSFRASLHQGGPAAARARALAWVAILGLPATIRAPAGRMLVGISRRLA
jgi:glycosyltransferase involved in cell wall biosynthesis